MYPILTLLRILTFLNVNSGYAENLRFQLHNILSLCNSVIMIIIINIKNHGYFCNVAYHLESIYHDRNTNIIAGTTVEKKKGKLILTEIFPSVQKHDIF